MEELSEIVEDYQTHQSVAYLLCALHERWCSFSSDDAIRDELWEVAQRLKL